MAEEIDVENGRNSNFEGLVTLTLTFDPAVLDSQAAAVSRIRRRIFVRRKSAEKSLASRIRRRIFVRWISAEKYFRRLLTSLNSIVKSGSGWSLDRRRDRNAIIIIIIIIIKY